MTRYLSFRTLSPLAFAMSVDACGANVADSGSSAAPATVSAQDYKSGASDNPASDSPASDSPASDSDAIKQLAQRAPR